MNPLIVIAIILNIIFLTREFFAVWDHIDSSKYQGQIPDPEDYFELILVGVLISVTFVAFCSTFFR
jgi:hypothetical protein